MRRYLTTIDLKKFLVYLCFILVFILLTAIPLPWNELQQDTFIDLQFKLRGSRMLSDQILLVFIGDADIKLLNEQKGWPITRDYYSYAIYIANHLGASAIGMDVLLDRSDANYPEYDETLADMIKSAGNVCLPMTFAELAANPAAKNRGPASGQLPTFPIQTFRSASAGLGFSNFNPERIARKVPVLVSYRDSLLLSFGSELARIYLDGAKSIGISRHAMVLTSTSGQQHVFPIDSRARLRLNHFGSIQDLSALAFTDFLRLAETNPEKLNFRNKIVLIAVTAASVVKLQATPLSSALPATLIHATVAENLISGNFLKDVPMLFHWLIIAILVILASQLLRLRSKLAKWLSAIAVISGYWLIAMLFFSSENRVLPLFYPTLAYLLTLLYSGVVRGLELHRQEETVKSMLSAQIANKEAELEAAKATLAEFQRQLELEASESEQTRQRSEERESVILRLEKELRDLKSYTVPQKHPPELSFPEIIHASTSKMTQVLALVTTVAADDIPILIMGETGTGKEMIARAIHRASKRKAAPFVAINCGALPETLLESELFGHEKGSFTGAHARRRGRFELANGGIIFLDEITETTPVFQTRLLRVLQEGSFERLGGEQTCKVDVRVIAATNKDLQIEMEQGRFRTDLFYRLQGFPITIPPLRERKEDIPLLALHFLKKYHHFSINAFSDRAIELLQNYPWPGNVRELENSVRRMAILAQSEKRKIIRENDLPDEILTSKIMPASVFDYQPLEEQILGLLRSYRFSRSAITQTARMLGNRDRGTITEHFRGICFERLVQSDFVVDEAARNIASTSDPEIIQHVKVKINEYVANLQAQSADMKIDAIDSDHLPPAFRGLPKKYHGYLFQVLQNMHRVR